MIKILTRAEMNRMKVSELKDLVKKFGMKLSINTKEDAIRVLLNYYKKLYNNGKLFVEVG